MKVTYVMSQIILKLHSIEKKCSSLAVTDNARLNQQPKLMGVIMFDGINKTMNGSDEV